MFNFMAALTLLLTAADHWTTYRCLSQSVTGWTVTEANPLADWLFSTLGLLPGLVLDTLFTVGAIAFLLTTRRIPALAKGIFFGFVVAWTGHAVVNNLKAMSVMGLPLVGGA